jgi:hypothetical protein
MPFRYPIARLLLTPLRGVHRRRASRSGPADRAISSPPTSNRQPSQPNSENGPMAGGAVVRLAAMAMLDVAWTLSESPEIRFLAKS